MAGKLYVSEEALFKEIQSSKYPMLMLEKLIINCKQETRVQTWIKQKIIDDNEYDNTTLPRDLELPSSAKELELAINKKEGNLGIITETSDIFIKIEEHLASDNTFEDQSSSSAWPDFENATSRDNPSNAGGRDQEDSSPSAWPDFENATARDNLSNAGGRDQEDSSSSAGPDFENVTAWDNLANPGDRYQEDFVQKIVRFGEAIYLVQESNPDQLFKVPVPAIITGNVPDYLPSLSLQPWKGDFDFSVSLETVKHYSSKWVYSNALKKLFMRPFEAVPVEVKVSNWINGYINITPVYTSSQHNAKPVNRCPIHRIQDEVNAVAHPEHIIQVVNADASYRVDGLRYSVDVPLGVPAPGKASKLLYVKCGCWNTCTGGPNRMAFCLLFTLFNRCKKEIGRQVIQLKVCAYPVRDRQFSEKNVGKPKKADGNQLKSDVAKKKLSEASPSKTSLKKIEAELGETSKETPKSDVGRQTYKQINVPTQIAPEVKRHVNRLMAELYAKEMGFSLPFPDF